MISFPTYVSLLKNIRGVVFFNPKIKLEEEIRWLIKKFRYRNLGLAPSLFESLSEDLKQKFSAKIFQILPHPFAETKDLVTRLESKKQVVVETLILASNFVAPIITLKQDSIKDFNNFIIQTLRSRQKFSDKEIKRNLRLINYSVLDFHQKVCEELYEQLETKRSLNEILKKRQDLARMDMRRFWRIKPSKSGKIVIAYLDIIKAIPKRILLKVLETDKLRLSFGLVVSFVLDLHES